MRSWVKVLLPVMLVGGSVMLVMALAGKNAQNRPERKAQSAPTILVDTIETEVSSLNFVVHSQGTVRARTNTTLVSEVSGKVVDVSPNFVAGGFFRKGETLLRIDPSDYETALKRAEASLASMTARLADETARSEQALKDWNNLGRTGEPSDLVLRKPQLLDAQANVSAAEADVQKARRDLQRTRITIPYDGLVTSKLADIGQFVTPGSQLGTSISVDTAEVRLPLSRGDLQFLNLPRISGRDAADNLPVRLIATEGGIERSWVANMIRTEGVVDESSRVVYVVAEVADPYGLLGHSEQDELRIGTFVSAQIQGKRAENVVVLPRYALQDDYTVLVANQSHELEVRQVTLLRTEPDLVYISAGLSGGEHVITTTLPAPIPGTRVSSSDHPAPAAAQTPAVSGSDGD